MYVMCPKEWTQIHSTELIHQNTKTAIFLKSFVSNTMLSIVIELFDKAEAQWYYIHLAYPSLKKHNLQKEICRYAVSSDSTKCRKPDVVYGFKDCRFKKDIRV